MLTFLNYLMLIIKSSKNLLFLPTLSDQYSDGPFDVNRTAMATKNKGAANSTKIAIPSNKSKIYFIILNSHLDSYFASAMYLRTSHLTRILLEVPPNRWTEIGGS